MSLKRICNNNNTNKDGTRRSSSSSSSRTTTSSTGHGGVERAQRGVNNCKPTHIRRRNWCLSLFLFLTEADGYHRA